LRTQKATCSILCCLLFLVSGRVTLDAVAPLSDWNDYQKEVLKEQAHFSGWCPAAKAEHIMNLLLSNGSRICVELGVFGGSSFFPIAATLAFKKEGIAYAIDPWDNEECLVGYEDENDKQHKYWGKLKLDEVLYKFIEKMHLHALDANYLIMRMTSAKACPHFADASIDFIHIDGNHSEQSAIFDVQHWLPKVKKGGIICLDDAWWDSTQPAIKILLKQCEIMQEESSPKWQYLFLRKR
jgi:hypothetical protein